MLPPPPAPHPILQIIDSGLDETSCFFADEDGEEVTHGYYFDELSDTYSTSNGGVVWFTDFDGGDFFFDSSRRKVGTVCDCC